ncbi:potassium voltage-gated channel subfamily C member 3-like [Physella acuta]|uniref:potassium voltage-gated channel subfamily C member 3-like n=1 Tax=Physella acuta TaxID=109671 RepID=UPI0027DB0CDD|nr:potassium voltage-gated channel subfamily C member 3-like [Physella acuta]
MELALDHSDTTYHEGGNPGNSGGSPGFSTVNIKLVVSGKTYWISRQALATFPNTRLGQLALRHRAGEEGTAYVFDRNTKMVNPILDLYRTGELHLPGNMCGLAISRELRYWGINDKLISECCIKRYREALREVLIVEELDTAMKLDSVAKDSISGQIWLTMERPGHNLWSWVWFGVYMTFILMSIVVVAVSSVREFRVYRVHDSKIDKSKETLLDNLLNSDLCTPILVFDVMGLVFFTVEPLVRLCVAPNPKAYLTKILNLLDLFLAVDHWTCFFMEWNENLLVEHEGAKVAHATLRAVLSLRVFRIFHVARRYLKMKVLFLTFRASMAELFLLFLGLFIAVIMYATVIYYVEMLEKANNFTNIPQAIWWAIVTMTTVGYGDFYPTTVSGYFVGVLCTLSGLLLLSMPIAIIASNFGTYYNGLMAREQRDKRKKFLMEHRLDWPLQDGQDDWRDPACPSITDGQGNSIQTDFENRNTKKEENLEESDEFLLDKENRQLLESPKQNKTETKQDDVSDNARDVISDTANLITNDALEIDSLITQDTNIDGDSLAAKKKTPETDLKYRKQGGQRNGENATPNLKTKNDFDSSPIKSCKSSLLSSSFGQNKHYSSIETITG